MRKYKLLKKWYETKIKPDYRADDLLSIDWAAIKAKSIELVFLDIDNTLAEHGARRADDYAQHAIRLIREHNLPICLLSNALSSRIEEYASSLKVDYLEQANKPSCKRIYAKLRELDIKPENSILVGDQLFTDIWAGNKAGCITILVKQRFLEEALQVRMKRKLEQFLYNRFEAE